MTAIGIWDIRRQFPRSVPRHADLIMVRYTPIFCRPYTRGADGQPCASNRSWDGWLFTYGIISTRRLLNSLPGRHGDDILTKHEALEGS
jgi:hypothetical protein